MFIVADLVSLMGVPMKQEIYNWQLSRFCSFIERLIFVAKSSSRVWKDLDSFKQKKYSEQLSIWSILHVRLNKNYTAQTVTSYEPWYEISNNVVCATSKGSDQIAHTRSLIRAFASRLNIQWVLSYWPDIIWSF